MLALTFHTTNGYLATMRFERALQAQPWPDTGPVTDAPLPSAPSLPIETTSVPAAITSAPAAAPALAETTAAPVATIALPVGTAPASVEATTAPVATTPTPVETTPVPAETTPVPGETTPVPVEATPAPVGTTSAPAATTQPPVDTTPAPEPINPTPAAPPSPPEEIPATPVETPSPKPSSSAPPGTISPPAETAAPPAETNAPPATESPTVDMTAPTPAPSPTRSDVEPPRTERPSTNPSLTLSLPVVGDPTAGTPTHDPLPVSEEPPTDSPLLNPTPSTVSNVRETPQPISTPQDSEADSRGSKGEVPSSSSAPPEALSTSEPPLIAVLVVTETNTPTTPGIAAVFAKKDEGQDISSERPPQQDSVDGWEQTGQPEKYIRGQTPIEDMNDPWKNVTGNHSENSNVRNPPLIIGGKNRGTASAAGTPYAEVGTKFHRVVRNVASVVSAIAVVLLLAFHFVSLDSTLRWPSPAWSPNAWEFCVYVIYLQQMTSLSELTLLRSPFFLWHFTDAFAWTRFLVQHTTPTSPSTERRRLDSVLILDGLVGFADRIGLKETKLLRLAVTGFAATLGTLLFGVAIAAAIAYRRRATSRTSTGYRLLGLCGLVWFFSVYPPSIMASFEITMEIYSGLFSPSLLALAVLTIALGCVFTLALLTRAVLRKTEHELRDYKHIAIFGAFYLDSRYSTRLFFVLAVFVQLVAGLSIGVLNSNKLLLSILIGVHGLYILAIVWMKPFTNSTLRIATIAVSVLAIANFSLSFAFLRGTVMPLARRVAFANAFIAINTIVLLLWFARHLVLFVNAVKAILRRKDHEHVGSTQQDAHITKHHAREETFSVDMPDDTILLHPLWRFGWSPSMSLSGSFSANDISPVRARVTPRTAYTAVTDT